VIRAVFAIAVSLAVPIRALAQTDEFQRYSNAKTAYEGGDFEEAVRRFAPLVDGGPDSLTSHALLQESRKYYGASLVLVGRGMDAAAVFRTLLTDTPTEDLSPSLFTTRVRDVFNGVKSEMAAELAQREAEIREAEERQRREQEARVRAEILSKAVLYERTIERRPLWQGFLPFGIAQFQNDQSTKGVLFLAGEGLLLGVNVVSYFLSLQLAGPYKTAQPDIKYTLGDIFFYANIASLCGLGTLLGLGAWDGVANLETERVVKRRLTPEEIGNAIDEGNR
jgi:hypothetical protein